MKFNKNFTISSIISTWFLVGKIPIMPGTFGSLAAYPIYYLLINLSNNIPSLLYFLYASVIVLTIIGTWSIHKYHKIVPIDHKSIVIDEVIGQLLTITLSINVLPKIANQLPITLNEFNISKTNLMFLLAFITFRLFDITKPLGIRWLEKKMKNAFGVILDDILAALLAAASIQAIYIAITFITN